jgi:mono/diheme cytochrome c family protein
VPPSQAPFTPPPAPAPVVDIDTEVPMPVDDYPDMDAAMRGRYIAANIGVCLECHTPETAPGSEAPRDCTKSFQGGRAFPAAAFGLPVPPFPETIYTANVTPHANGHGDSYTVEDIAIALKQGVDPNGDGICPPMPAGPMGEFRNLTDQDAMDLGHYLRSLPPGDNMVPNECSIDLTP